MNSVPRCLYCESADTEPLYSGVTDRLGFVPGTRSFARCRACGSAVLDPLPGAEELPAFYPPVYSFAPDMGGARGLRRLISRAEYRLYFGPQYAAQVRRVLRQCGWRNGAGKQLLDVGCGRGLRLLEFRRRGFDVHGLDVLPDVVRYLNEELHIPARCADVSKLWQSYDPGSFDLITAYFLIEHIPNVREAFAAMYNLLKPGGWLAAAVPLCDSIQAKIFGRAWIEIREAPRHLSLPTRKGLSIACRAGGFEDVNIRPDSALNCAGQVASSLIPGATLTHAYGQSRLLPLAKRAIGAGVMLASLPWCLFENHVAGRSPVGILFARKPEAPDS